MGLNKPVDFTAAKLLKEKGFDNQSLSIYQDGELMILKSTISNSQFMTSRNYSAPTISEVVMWLYETHKIWVSVGGDCNYKFKFEIHTWNWYELEKTYRMGHIVLGETFWHTSSEPFNSPTEAYEAAIEYTLNNLIK